MKYSGYIGISKHSPPQRYRPTWSFRLGSCVPALDNLRLANGRHLGLRQGVSSCCKKKKWFAAYPTFTFQSTASSLWHIVLFVLIGFEEVVLEGLVRLLVGHLLGMRSSPHVPMFSRFCPVVCHFFCSCVPCFGSVVFSYCVQFSEFFL